MDIYIYMFKKENLTQYMYNDIYILQNNSCVRKKKSTNLYQRMIN